MMGLDEQAVYEALCDDESLHMSLRRIVERTTWWDSRDSSWEWIDKASGELLELLENVALDGIDAHELYLSQIICAELKKENLAAGRDADAGLP